MVTHKSDCDRYAATIRKMSETSQAAQSNHPLTKPRETSNTASKLRNDPRDNLNCTMIEYLPKEKNITAWRMPAYQLFWALFRTDQVWYYSSGCLPFRTLPRTSTRMIPVASLKLCAAFSRFYSERNLKETIEVPHRVYVYEGGSSQTLPVLLEHLHFPESPRRL